MPYIPINSTKALLTTAEDPEIDYFGTIIANDRQYSPAPWIRNVAENPLTIWYWIREAQGRRVFSRSFKKLKLVKNKQDNRYKQNGRFLPYLYLNSYHRI